MLSARYNIVYLFSISEQNLSKGGLDERVFLANKSISDVANLIMFGTPNAGAPLASPNDSCSSTAKDFVWLCT